MGLNIIVLMHVYSNIKLDVDEEKICTAIQMRLAGEIASIQRSFYSAASDTMHLEAYLYFQLKFLPSQTS